MKRKKLVIILSVLLIVLIGGAVGGYFYFHRTTEDSSFNLYLTQFEGEEGHYYLRKAPTDLTLEVKVKRDSDAEDCIVIDEYDEVTDTELKSLPNGNYQILPPKEGYLPGGFYTLTLPDNVTFWEDDLKDARKLSFSIEKEEIARYEFTENVTETDTTLRLKDEDTLYLEDTKAKVGDILFGTDENGDYAVHKITKLNDDGTAEVELPALEEVYEDLEAYGEVEWDLEQLVINPEFATEIAENVRNSEFFDRLVLQAYADEVDIPTDIGIEVDPEFNPSDNSLGLTIKITLEPGKNGLFGVKQLDKQKVTLTLNPTLKYKGSYNIKNIKNWDIAATVTTSFHWSIALSLYTDELEDDELADFFASNPKTSALAAQLKATKAINEKLSKLANDVIEGEISIFKWKLPVPNVPGLTISADVKLFASLEVAADLTISQTITTTYTAGLRVVDGEFTPYTNKQNHPSDDLTITLQGKASFKAGIKLVITASLVKEDWASISIDPQFGLYADLYITVPVAGLSDMKNPRTFVSSYFEPGCYFSADFKAKLHLVKAIEFSRPLGEVKFKFTKFVFGSPEIPMRLQQKANLASWQVYSGRNWKGAAVKASAGMLTLPDFELVYYDVTDQSTLVRTVDFKDLKFYLPNGTALSTISKTIPVPPSFSEGENHLTVQYQVNGKVFSTTLPVEVPTSKLTGMVSEYKNGETTPLQWAKVQIFAASDLSKAIRTSYTDAEGRFSLAVQPGNYKIVVSAIKHLPLETWQYVGEDEIKHTEHVLLIEEPEEDTTGTASGTLTNAINGQGISDATIRIREDWNNTEGEYFGDFETVTDYNGDYTIDDVPSGYYTVEASQDGFVAGHSNIIVMDEYVKSDFDFTITPELNEDEIRVVLTWGATPSDLDSHITGKDPDGYTFHVYYSSKDYYYDGETMINLDVDDTSSYGPETITILREINDTYTYYVHDYTNGSYPTSDTLSYSNAVVRVFKGSSMLAEYYVPTGYNGIYWNVFRIDERGRITPVNTITEQPALYE